jgi:hypothetical protein
MHLRLLTLIKRLKKYIISHKANLTSHFGFGVDEGKYSRAAHAEDTQIDTNTYDSTKNTHTINETYETIN